MPIYEIENTVWISYRDFTLVEAATADKAQEIFEEKYDGRQIDPFKMHPEAIQIEAIGIKKYDLSLVTRGEEDSVDILE